MAILGRCWVQRIMKDIVLRAIEKLSCQFAAVELPACFSAGFCHGCMSYARCCRDDIKVPRKALHRAILQDARLAIPGLSPTVLSHVHPRSRHHVLPEGQRGQRALQVRFGLDRANPHQLGTSLFGMRYGCKFDSIRLSPCRRALLRLAGLWY
jgi:hypothetical protein